MSKRADYWRDKCAAINQALVELRWRVANPPATIRAWKDSDLARFRREEARLVQEHEKAYAKLKHAEAAGLHTQGAIPESATRIYTRAERADKHARNMRTITTQLRDMALEGRPTTESITRMTRMVEGISASIKALTLMHREVESNPPPVSPTQDSESV